MTNNEYEIKRHEIFKQAALYCYDEKNKQPPEGYKLVKSVHAKSGFDASVLKNGNDIIIAYQGTNKLSLKDWNNDAQILAGQTSKQCREGRQLYKEIHEQYPNAKISTTGHSLGGAISQYVSAVEWCKSVNFNPLGAREVLMKNMDAFDITGIVNYCNSKDIVSAGMADKQLGRCYEISSKAFAKEERFQHHKLENMADLRLRKKTTKDELKKQYSERKCNGTHHVNGYTRGDGIKVESYTRGCASNHTHQSNGIGTSLE